jgi:N-acetylneuraminic acid mutarotase
MRTALAITFALLLVRVLLPNVKAAHVPQRQPIPGDATPIETHNLGVPVGHMILGTSKDAPTGFSFTGLSLNAGPTSPVWRTAPPLPTSRDALGAAVVQGNIFAIGGYSGVYSSATEEFSPTLNAWITRAPMPTPRSRLTAVTANDRIYAIGGFNGVALASNEEFDPSTNIWTTRAPLPVARTMHVSAEVAGRIYVIGGSFDELISCNLVDEYDPHTDSWISRNPMPTPRGRLAVAVVNGKIFAMRGSNEHLPIEEYDPATDSWRTRSSTNGYDWAAASVNGRIYRFGGTEPTETYEYDIDAGTTTRKSRLLTARVTPAAVTLGGFVYAIGGSDAEGRPLNAVESFNPGRPMYLHEKN